MAKPRFGSMFLSLVVAAALLPVALMGVLNPEGLRFVTRADQPNEMRVWIEPAEVITRPGIKVKLTVMGNFESETSLVPEFKGTIKSEGIEATPTEISYKEPFRGAVALGTFYVVAKQAGQFEVKIDEGSVFLSLPNIPVNSAGALIISRK
ncbi:MAG: hypothetical protein WC657_08275 [Candidatus Paceibacterota bacterium]|jgi:hypothetical protein